MDICSKKNQINDLLQDIFAEYNRMNETKIQSKCESDLDMRFNYNDGLTAKDFLNSTDEKTLSNIIYLNSGEKKSRKIATSIMQNVNQGNMETTLDLRNSIQKVVGKKYLIKSLSRVFQAIRIHINNE